MQNIRRSVLSVCLGILVLCSVVSVAETSPHPPGLACQSALTEAYAPPIDRWIGQLRVAYQGAESTLAIPPSFRSHSWWSRAKNDLFLLNLKRSFASTKFLSNVTWVARGTIFEGIAKFASAAEAESTMTSVGRGFLEMRRFQREFREDIAKYKGIYGEQFFGQSVFDKGTVNTMMAKLFAMLDGKVTPRSRDAVNAIALLHPITDEALDQGTISKASIAKLSKFLEGGEWPSIETPYENVVFGLLGYIYRDFPPETHPTLHLLLNRLHVAQVRSLAQKRSMSESDLLHVSFDKGGLSLAIAAYLALDGLSPTQYEFFFKAGAVFQILDDLSDISTDLEEGGKTVWTTALGDGRSLGPVVDRFFALQAEFERSIPEITSGFDENQLFSRIYLTAFKLTTMRAFVANRKHFSRKELSSIRKHFPVSFLTVRKGFEHAGKSDSIPEELREIARALDSY